MYVRTVEMAEMMASFTVVALEIVETYKTFIKIIGYRYGGKNPRQSEGECFHLKFIQNSQAKHLTHFTFN
jgi:hypothetical protein